VHREKQGHPSGTTSNAGKKIRRSGAEPNHMGSEKPRRKVGGTLVPGGCFSGSVKNTHYTVWAARKPVRRDGENKGLGITPNCKDKVSCGRERREKGAPTGDKLRQAPGTGNAQDLRGSWQGSLPKERPKTGLCFYRRMVFAQNHVNEKEKNSSTPSARG